MELYVAATGQIDNLNRWANDLNSQFFPVYRNGKKETFGKNAQGKEIINHRRLLVAPVQIYKIAFAKEELENVLPIVCPMTYVFDRYPILKRVAKMVRKVLKLKEVPIPKFTNPLLQPNQVDKAVAIVPIGIKDDIIEKGYELI